jgi:hypothetical protein
MERVEYGVDAVKELLSTLTSDKRCGVMLEFEDLDPDKFAQLVSDAPQSTGWFDLFRHRIKMEMSTP